MVHTRGLWQSVLSRHAAPGNIFFSELQPIASQDEKATKPRTRNDSADISILQFVFSLRRNLAAVKGSQQAFGCACTSANAMPRSKSA
jgi:hypothetical protein